MLARCLEDLNLRGRTDGRGDARVDCDLSRIGAAVGTTVFGVVAFFGADVEAPPATSPAAATTPTTAAPSATTTPTTAAPAGLERRGGMT